MVSRPGLTSALGAPAVGGRGNAGGLLQEGLEVVLESFRRGHWLDAWGATLTIVGDGPDADRTPLGRGR